MFVHGYLIFAECNLRVYKNLGFDMKDVKPTQVLKGRVCDIESNPDFSNKDYAIQYLPQPIVVSKP